jgi:hypothetical protein
MKKYETSNKITLHGEAVVVDIDALPEGCKPVKHNGDVIVAPSETVGHHHRIYCEQDEVEVFEKDGDMYLKVNKPVSLTCKGKHDKTPVMPGIKKIDKQREWDYIQQMERQVAD